jgi:DNA-binding MarR family transcriptional regulator
VLVHLSEADDGRCRMSQLADAVLISRSGLTRRVDRMVKSGLISKELCLEDRRGTFASITQQGWDALRAAAPVHVAGVRRRFIDRVSKDDESSLLGQLLRLRDQRDGSD